METPVPITRRDRSFDHRDQLLRRRQWTTFTRADNGARNAPRKSFLAELENHIGQLRFRPLIDQVSRRSAFRLIHAHVQWTIPLKTKPTSRFVQLRRRHTKIKQNSIDPINATGSKMLFQFHKVTMNEVHAVAESRKPLSAGCNGHRIAIKTNKSGVRTA